MTTGVQPPVAESSESPVLGVDIGGTKIELVLVDATGRLLQSARAATEPERGARRVVEAAASIAHRAFGARLGGARAIGVSVAGQVSADGVLLGAPNLGWSNVRLKEEVEQAFRLPSVVVNDVRAAAWAEWRDGAGRGSTEMVALFIGTGVGGAVIAGGRMLTGCSNSAGEVGHATLVAGGRRCHCRNLGCLEAYVSGWAIAEQAQELARGVPASAAVLVALAGTVERVTAETVAAARDRGDPGVLGLIAQTGRMLGAAVVGLVNGLNPCLVVMGGGVVAGFPELIPAVQGAVREHALPAAAAAVRIVPAVHAESAPALGAAAVAREVREGSTAPARGSRTAGRRGRREPRAVGDRDGDRDGDRETPDLERGRRKDGS